MMLLLGWKFCWSQSGQTGIHELIGLDWCLVTLVSQVQEEVKEVVCPILRLEILHVLLNFQNGCVGE